MFLLGCCIEERKVVLSALPIDTQSAIIDELWSTQIIAESSKKPITGKGVIQPFFDLHIKIEGISVLRSIAKGTKFKKRPLLSKLIPNLCHIDKSISDIVVESGIVDLSINPFEFGVKSGKGEQMHLFFIIVQMK